ncbi:unnamed protein product, partial [Closterium sp. NIES-53]
ALYDAVVARYSLPATAALGRLLLPYVFSKLSAFATVEDLVSHLRTSDARYRATVHAKFLDRNQPPMFITLYFIVTRLPDSLRSVLLVALCARPSLGGAPPPPFYASAAAADVEAASASAKHRSGKGKGGSVVGGGSGGGGGGSSGGGGGSGGGGSGGSGGGSGGFGGGGGGSGGSGGSGSSGSGDGRTGDQRGDSGGGQSGSCAYVIRTGDRAGQTCGKPHTQHCCFSRLDDACRAKFGDEAERPRKPVLLRSGVAIFDLDYDAILAAMYALSVSAEGDCYLCVLPDPGIEAAALGAFTTLTPLSAPVPVRLADPSEGPVLARSSTVLPCPAVPSGSLSGLHLPSFSTNLVSASPPTLACPALPSLCRGAAARRSSLLLISPEEFSPVDSPHGRRRIGLVMEVARNSMIHAAAPHFLCPFAVRYVVHQLNLWPRFSLPETSPTLRWTRKVGDVLVFRVWGSRAFVRDTFADKLSTRAIPYVFLGFSPDAHGYQFYHPTLRRVFHSQDVTFDELVSFNRLFPYHSAPPPPPPLFLAPGPPPVDPLPHQVHAPSGVSQVDPLPSTAPVEVAFGSGAAPSAASEGAASGGAEPGGAEFEGVGLRLVLPPLFALVVVFLVHVLLLSPAHTLWHFVLPLFHYVSLCLLILRLLFLQSLILTCRLDYATPLVAESASASLPSIGGECALGTDFLEDSQEDFECLAAAIPRFASMLLAPEGDLDAPDIPTPRSYAEAITGPYSSQWQATMDAEMASWKSIGTYVDTVPPSRANIVDGMWIFRVKRPPGSPSAFKACYVA